MPQSEQSGPDCALPTAPLTNRAGPYQPCTLSIQTWPTWHQYRPSLGPSPRRFRRPQPLRRHPSAHWISDPLGAIQASVDPAIRLSSRKRLCRDCSPQLSTPCVPAEIPPPRSVTCPLASSISDGGSLFPQLAPHEEQLKSKPEPEKDCRIQRDRVDQAQ